MVVWWCLLLFVQVENDVIGLILAMAVTTRLNNNKSITGYYYQCIAIMYHRGISYC